MVDLPAPVWPIIPKNPPESTLNDTSFRTLIVVPGYANVTESKEIEEIKCDEVLFLFGLNKKLGPIADWGIDMKD